MEISDLATDMKARIRLAKKAETDQAYLWQIATGRRKASHKLCKRIEKATRNKITRHDLRPDIYGPAPKAAA